MRHCYWWRCITVPNHQPLLHMTRLFILSLSIASLALSSVQTHASESSWATFSGEVVAVNDSSFLVDYGKGKVEAMVKHWKWFGADAAELRGLKVRVSGQMMEGGAEPAMKLLGIYLPEHHSYHFSKVVDAGALAAGSSIWQPNDTVLDVGSLVVVGIVLSIDEPKFVINTGQRKIEVDAGKLQHNPLDQVGKQQIKVGDQVMVTAVMDDDYFKLAKLEAGRVTSLVPNLD